jgi:uncharacterized damage-inducible protein DinB
MTLTQHFLAELEAEAPRTRRVLDNVPHGHDDWKPHDKSMPLARLAGLVATMPSWVNLIVDQDELDLTPPGGGTFRAPSVAELATKHDEVVAAAKACLQKTDDQYLLSTNWRLKAGGHVVLNDPRHIVLRDTFNHLAHHRGQLTVYLRLLGQPVPAVYGPSADDQRFL